MIDRALGMLRNAVIAVFVAALIAGMALPVYTDEIGWRFQERAGFDGVDKMFSDVCGANSLARPPFFMMPVRWYSALFNGAFADPFWVRASGVLYALLWVALALLLVRRAAGDAGPALRTRLHVFCFGPLALGTMPLLMVWSRPEQPVVLAMLGALLLALADWRDPHRATSAGTAWRRSAAVLLLGIVAASYHVKGVVAAPLFLACLFFASRGRAAHLPRIAAATLLTGAVGWAAWYWVHRLQCPDDPVLRAAYAVNNMGAVLTGPDGRVQPLAAVFKLLANMGLAEYFGLPTPRVEPLSWWLEPDQIASGPSFAWFLVLTGLWTMAVLVAAIALVSGGCKAWQGRRIDARPALAAVLFAVVLAWSATQLIRNVYEACFVLPVVAMAVVLALPSLPDGGRLGRWRDGLAIILGLCAMASPFAIAAIYGPSLARANAQAGYVQRQPNSLPVFGYSRVRNDVAAVARQCGIPRDGTARAVMVDDLTYFSMMHTRLPQHRLGVTGLWRGSIDDPVAYLKSRGSSGIVVGCHLLPANLRARAKAQGMFCCLGPPNW